MILTNTEINYIEKVINVAKLVDIDSIIIETGAVRAASDDRSVFILQKDGVPPFSFSAIGLNRLDTFTSRLDIVKSPNLTINAVMDDKNQFIRSLIMKSDKINIEYRCASPSIIKAVKTFSDIISTQVTIPKEAIPIIQRGQAAMKAETIRLIANGTKLTIECLDINSDKFEYSLSTNFFNCVTMTPSTSSQFKFDYSFKLFLTLLKNNQHDYFKVGQRGILNITINGIDVYILPRA